MACTRRRRTVRQPHPNTLTETTLIMLRRTRAHMVSAGIRHRRTLVCLPEDHRMTAVLGRIRSCCQLTIPRPPRIPRARARLIVIRTVITDVVIAVIVVVIIIMLPWLLMLIASRIPVTAIVLVIAGLRLIVVPPTLVAT